MSDILKQWQLRAHPFSPRMDAKGQAYIDDTGAQVGRDFWQQPLNPQIDSRFIDFYFDFYDWKRSDLIQFISKQTAFQKFTAVTALRDPKSLLIIIQGSDGTGRESLRNLILHKVNEESGGSAPVVVETELDSFHHAENIKQIARTFYDAYDNSKYTQPTRAELKTIYDEEKDAPNPGAETFYASMFRRFNTKVRSVRKDHRMVLLLKGVLTSGGDSYDTWRVIYNSTSPLFQYIIVMTTREDQANSIHTLFRRDNKNVALIKARELELNEARNYLAARLDQERTAPVNDRLLPFTEAALSELFLPGSGAENKAGQSNSIPFNIEMLNRTFLCALDYHLCQLENKDIKQLNAQDLLIGPGTILEVRRRINSGEDCPAPKSI
jgi:hypothetical protein